MSVTRTQAVANVREVADATGSSRWSDTWIKTVLGLVGMREWAGILGANPSYRLNAVSTTADSSGLVAYSALSTGSADSAKNFHKILAVTDGQSVYRQREFKDGPLATTASVALLSSPEWYDAGQNLQILPAAGTALTITVNWMPTRIDSLSGDGVTIDFPEGSEVILWLEAAAMLLSKGGAENEAAETMRAMAQQEREMMYQRIQRRSTNPMYLGFADTSSEWGGQ